MFARLRLRRHLIEARHGYQSEEPGFGTTWTKTETKIIKIDDEMLMMTRHYYGSEVGWATSVRKRTEKGKKNQNETPSATLMTDEHMAMSTLLS